MFPPMPLLELALSQTINLFRSFAGKVFLAKRTSALVPIGKIGAKSFNKSY